MRLLLDEHFSPAIAEQLRERGYDVLPVAERVSADDALLRRRSDEELLRWARDEQRVILTENVRDFIAIHQAFLARGEAHAGILFTSPRKFPRRSDMIGLLVTALAAFLDSYTMTELDSDIGWL